MKVKFQHMKHLFVIAIMTAVMSLNAGAQVSDQDEYFDNLSTKFQAEAGSGEINLGAVAEFSSLEIPGKISLKNVGVQVRKTETENIIFLTGEAEIFKKNMNIVFGISKNPDYQKNSNTDTKTTPSSTTGKTKLKQPKYRMFIWGSVSGEWDVFKSIPGLNKLPILKNMSLKDSGILFSNANLSLPAGVFPENSQKLLQDHLGEGVETLEAGRGINLFAKTSLKGIAALDKARELFALKPETQFHALVSPETAKNYIEGKFAEFETPKFFPKWFKGTSLTMRLDAKGSVSLSIPVSVELPPKKDLVTFSVDVSILKGKGKAGAKDLTLSIAGRMNGTWNNALGIKGFAMEDIVLSGETALAKANLSIGMGGTFYIGSKKVELAAILPATPNVSSLAFKASLNSIGLKDILDMTSKMMEKATGKKIPMGKVPVGNIEFRNLAVSFAPAGGSETVGIEEGISFQGALYINNKLISDTYFKSSTEGIFIKQNIAAFKLGPLEVTGGPGMEKQGPLIDLALTSDLAQNHMIFSGGVKLFGVLAAVTFEFQEKEVFLKGQLKLFKLYEAKIEGSMNLDPKNLNFYAKIELESNFAEEMNKLVNTHLKDKMEEINKKLEKKKNDATAKINHAQDKLDQEKDKVRKLNDQIKDAEEDMRKKMEPLNHALSKAIENLNHLKEKEKKTWEEYKKAKKIKKPKEWAEHAAVKTKRVAAQKVMEAAQKSANFMMVKLNPKVVGLKTAKNTALLALTAAEKYLEVVKVAQRETLEAFQAVNDGIVKGADFITSGGLFNLNKASFEGEIGKMAGGAEIEVQADFVFLKKHYNKKFKASIKDPVKMAKDLAKKIFEDIKDKIL